MDAIDLTLSSPEPEPRARPQANAHQRQQQPATGPKQETGSSSRGVDYGIRYAQEQDGSRSRNAPQLQPRQIHPQHVTQIIDSSNPRALRQVVLQLCKTSPALSGAIVRGLAPYSSYAQTLIRSQQAKSQIQTTRAVKTEPKPNAQDAYERMKKTLATSSSGQGSGVRSHGDRLSGISENRDGLRVPKTHTTPRVKREYRASSTDSDESSHIVDFPDLERLENFTVHPETPPLKFLPIRLNDDDHKYALRGDGVGDDLFRTPYLAAVTNNATRTVSLKIAYLPTPLRESFETQTDACPEGYDCTADQWTLEDASDSGVYSDFRFGGFKGTWEPFKDAGKEGWHIYWKGNAGVSHSIQFDLVPVTEVDGFLG
ncbi:hypothetical protein N0V94_001552 [Neodidymelliopsis sp. IMI 364377]|nr:hypothetical protein N0V94_001552 [Neodidymelliopsis sp. IMI 364377]